MYKKDIALFNRTAKQWTEQYAAPPNEDDQCMYSLTFSSCIEVFLVQGGCSQSVVAVCYLLASDLFCFAFSPLLIHLLEPQ